MQILVLQGPPAEEASLVKSLQHSAKKFGAQTHVMVAAERGVRRRREMAPQP
jgi:hypothetical protein